MPLSFTSSFRTVIWPHVKSEEAKYGITKASDMGHNENVEMQGILKISPMIDGHKFALVIFVVGIY